jgi:hypothetical protein
MPLLAKSPRPTVLVDAGPNVVDWLTLGVIVAAGAIAVFELDQARRSRYAAVMEEMFRRREGTRLRKIRTAIYGMTPQQLKTRMNDLIRTDPETFIEWMIFPDFFEDLGSLVRHRAVSVKLANAFLGGAIVLQWAIWKPWVEELRERRADEVEGSGTLYGNWEWLAGKLATKYQRRVSSPA